MVLAGLCALQKVALKLQDFYGQFCGCGIRGAVGCTVKMGSRILNGDPMVKVALKGFEEEFSPVQSYSIAVSSVSLL